MVNPCDLMKPDTSPRMLSARLEEARQFDLFVKRYRRPLLQYFRKRGQDPAEAEDLTQTALLQLLQRIRRQPEGINDGYVFTTASRVLIDHHRRRASRPLGATEEIDPNSACSEPLADKILEDRQTLRVMLRVLGKMRPKIRRVFELHRFDSLSYEEIAGRVGVSVSTVEKYVMTALAELRDSRDRDRHA